jgi:hypothetical protein
MIRSAGALRRASLPSGGHGMGAGRPRRTGAPGTGPSRRAIVRAFAVGVGGALALARIGTAPVSARTERSVAAARRRAAMTQADTIVADRLAYAPQPGDYSQLRYLALRGANRAIGRALGEVARADYAVAALSPYASPIYGVARNAYMAANYPILRERMRGVAEAYGVDPETTALDTSCLQYDLVRMACSAVYFPPDTTTNGHALLARNMDFYTVTANRLLGLPDAGGPSLLSRNVLVELRPDRGHPSLALGNWDLLNGALDAINRRGLTVAALVDQEATPTHALLAGGRASGLTSVQLSRLLLDTAATVEEAKEAILANKVFFPVDGVHYLIADPAGNATVFEINNTDHSYIFTDAAPGRPFVLTNFALWAYPDPFTFPKRPPTAWYNTFNRYVTLQRYLQGHAGKFTPQDAWRAMATVYGAADDSSEGPALPLPLRTIWTLLWDLRDRTLQLRIYRHDGPADPQTGIPTLVFSDPLVFSLSDAGAVRGE